MRSAVHFIPILTTFLAVVFATVVYRRYRERGGTHLLWWSGGLVVYAVGTFTEAFVTVFGWNEAIFRAWYISGALLGGAPLAQGTVYLLLQRRTAHRLAVALLATVTLGAVLVLLVPIRPELVEPHRLTGRVMAWPWVRAVSPFINLYALIFLVGGAALSAVRFRRRSDTYHRFVGNSLIAVGALLPGIGGSATRFGYTEVLYVTELIGLILIWFGYRWNVGQPVNVPSGSPVVSSAP